MMHRSICVVVTTLAVVTQSASAFVNPQSKAICIVESSTHRGEALYAEEEKKEEPRKAQGVYVRPSGAIERGSGFFVPGLEGPKVRVLFGGILLVLTAINHWVASQTASIDWSLEEGMAIGYALLVLFQAAIEYGKEELIVEGSGVSNSSKSRSLGSTPSSSNKANLVQQWSKEEGNSGTISDAVKERVQWAAASYLSITPATQMMLLDGTQILYKLGNDSEMNGISSTEVEKGVEAAFSQLKGSKGGRLALPATHPAVQGLGLDACRTVVLQRISPNRCWVMSSQDQLLASFTSSDLKWLGHMSSYVQ